MDYNNKYIKDFDEDSYIEYLSNPKLLDNLLSCYNERYKKDGKVNGKMILFQESLNHYVVKKLKESPSFALSDSFRNYKRYLQNALKYQSNFFFHNVFFRVFTKEQYIIFLGKDFYNQISRVNKLDVVKNINNKISLGQQLTQQELNFICDVYSFNRNPDNKFHKKLMEYIFSNLTNINSNLKCSSYVLDAILAYISKYYPRNDGFVPNNSRIIADDEYKGVAISHGQYYIFMNRSVFKNINFKSIEDSKKTYVKRGSDFTFLMIVANHELTHQYQNFMSHKLQFSNEGYMALKSHILNRELHDYSYNHDNDDIEIDATEKGWSICEKFYQEHMLNSQLSGHLRHQCKLNEHGTANRRFEYMKKDSRINTVLYTPFYDINNLTEILSRKPGYVNKFPMLQIFYDEKGKLSPNFLKINNICEKSVGGDYMAYLCLYYPNMVLNYLKKLDEKELNIAISNIKVGFRRYLRPIVYFDYNKINGLSSEHLKFEDDQENNYLSKHYKHALELYKYIRLIFLDSELMSKQPCLKSHLNDIESSMNNSTEIFNKRISANKSNNLKI